MFTVDPAQCVSCGACIATCPMGIFRRAEDGTVTARQHPCLDCYHCLSVCPTQAVTCLDSGTDLTRPLPQEDTPESRVLRRRSIRAFGPEAPSRQLLTRVLDAAAYAPSAKNCHPTQWTVVLGRDRVEEVRRIVLEWGADQPDFHPLTVAAQRGLDYLTCGAPCLIFAHAAQDAVSPRDDSVIAAALVDQVLAQEGLGSCWGGYLRRAAQRCPALQTLLGLPEGHTVWAVLMAGPSRERFLRLPSRSPAQISWVD